MKKRVLNLWDRQLLWLYLKYQLLTKGLLAAIVFPLYHLIIQRLLMSSGRTAISSGDYLSFLLSFQGLGLLAVSLLLLSLLVGLDINAFIIASKKLREGMPPTLLEMMRSAVASLRSFLRPSGLLLLLYVAFVLPLISIGFSLSPLENFQIPNFISSVILASPLLKTLYFLLLACLAFLTLRYLFTFHVMLLEEKSVREALPRARRLMSENKKDFLKNGILRAALRIIFCLAIGAALFLLMLLPVKLLQLPTTLSRFWLLLTFYLFLAYLALIALLVVPVAISEISELYERYRSSEAELSPSPVPREDRERSRRWLHLSALALLAVIVLAALYGTWRFSDINEKPPPRKRLLTLAQTTQPQAVFIYYLIASLILSGIMTTWTGISLSLYSSSMHSSQ